uniref:uncharacterized protein LOC105350884 n=1 Tax=Fragaria vesca subsp. vesca TaxID=101020 RepID=UPI0005C9BA03|nr:PREDICTED: uncharacterized protein LOC105350884 [Fragaria vesca subsp. vesca]
MVKIFVPEHNHELATGNQIAFVYAHRHVSDAALALTNTMTRVSIRPCHTYEYMVEQAGGYSVVGFTMKDLYNKLDQQRRTSLFESDSKGALSYMRALAAKDPHFICRFTTDLEDSTYKTNKPLVMFVGSNNHRGSIIFGAALISDETEETYTWLLRTFLESMNGKMAKAVLTDSDEAMRKAIETVMPEARHRLCIWHIGKNAFTHLKSEEKLKAFNRCVRKNQTVEQFERLWQEMIDELDLHDDIWIRNMYEKRDKFCQAFIGDIFMAGMRSTQMCEGMNKEFKRVLSKGKSLVELVALVYRLLMKLRHNQERDEFIYMNSFPGAVTHLVDLEIQASSIFTHDVFKWIVREIKKKSFNTLKQGAECHEDGSRVYKLSVYKRPEFDHTVVLGAVTHLVDLEIQASSIFTHDVFKWIVREIKKESFITLKQGAECHEDGSRVYKVSVHKRPEFDHTIVYHPEKETDSAKDSIMLCSCRINVSVRGSTMSSHVHGDEKEHIFELHKSLIVKRWSKDARTVCEIPYPDQSMPREALEVSKYGALTAECNRLCFYASKTDAGYNLLQKEISRLSSIVEGFAKEKEKVQAPATPSNMKGNVVRDPIPVRTKGREKMTRRLRLPDNRLLVVIAKVLDTTVKHVMLGRRKKKLRRAMKMMNETLTLVLQLQHLERDPMVIANDLDTILKHVMLGKRKKKLRRQTKMLREQYRALCTNSERSLSALWGKLAAEILMQNWDIALEELNRLKEIIDSKNFSSPLIQEFLTCVYVNYGMCLCDIE